MQLLPDETFADRARYIPRGLPEGYHTTLSWLATYTPYVIEDHPDLDLNGDACQVWSRGRKAGLRPVMVEPSEAAREAGYQAEMAWPAHVVASVLDCP